MNTDIALKYHTPGQQLLGLIGWLLLCFSASAIGVLASFQAQPVYASLTQPAWAPPGWLFGPVWTTLYVMMAVAAWLVWRQGGWSHNRKALLWFIGQLVLNALWSWFFFAWFLGLWSFVDICLLLISIAITTGYFWNRTPMAGVLMIPYLLWVGFAAVLNYAMWQLNHGMLG